LTAVVAIFIFRREAVLELIRAVGANKFLLNPLNVTTIDVVASDFSCPLRHPWVSVYVTYRIAVMITSLIEPISFSHDVPKVLIIEHACIPCGPCVPELRVRHMQTPNSVRAHQGDCLHWRHPELIIKVFQSGSAIAGCTRCLLNLGGHIRLLLVVHAVAAPRFENKVALFEDLTIWHILVVVALRILSCPQTGMLWVGTYEIVGFDRKVHSNHSGKRPKICS